MKASVSGVVPLGDPSFPAASATDAFIAAFSWQQLSGGVLIGAELGRITSRFGDSRVPKYGGFSVCPRKGLRVVAVRRQRECPRHAYELVRRLHATAVTIEGGDF
jgi:hypothetical protein